MRDGPSQPRRRRRISDPRIRAPFGLLLAGVGLRVLITIVEKGDTQEGTAIQLGKGQVGFRGLGIEFWPLSDRVMSNFMMPVRPSAVACEKGNCILVT